MRFIKDDFSFTYEEKKSKFIAHISSYSNFSQNMKTLREKHPKARHFVYAYRYLNEFDQIVENCSDDGEPKGTSGKPSLNVLAGNELINTAVIIIRYFGGVKLGTGGLVRAYGASVNEVIDMSTLHEYRKEKTIKLICTYTELSKLEHTINSFNIKITNKQFLENVELEVKVNDKEFDLLKENISRNIEIHS